MALNPDKVKFLIERISNADFHTLSSIANQIFNYLSEEIKDNPVYDKYEKEREKWKNWPNGFTFRSNDWTLPDKLEDAKSLSYDIYKSVAELGDNGNELSFGLFRESHFDDNINKLNSTFLHYLIEAFQDIVNANPELDFEAPQTRRGDIIFIIHGHDENLKNEVQLLLNNGGINNIILHQQPDKGRTIIEKLIEESKSAGYAIALLTPDDITSEGLKRARQNVIFEIGYFIGLIGKSRVRMLIKGIDEKPSDLEGILYEKYDSQGNWKMKILKEIQSVGIYVDFPNVINSI